MLPNGTIQVHVIHEDPLVAAGLAATLRAQPDMRLVGSAPHVTAPSSSAAGRVVPDVVVTDFAHGLALLDDRRGDPRWRREAANVMIVTSRDTECEIRHALERGARGYLLLGCGVDELVDGVRALHAGMRHVGVEAARRLADSVACEALTGREEAVLRLVVEGHGNKAIANRLEIAIGTVKSHLKSIFQKLDASSRTEVATVAERRGLLTMPGAGAHRLEPRAGASRQQLAAAEGHRAIDVAMHA